jgi:hypothetical protein
MRAIHYYTNQATRWQRVAAAAHGASVDYLAKIARYPRSEGWYKREAIKYQLKAATAANLAADYLTVALFLKELYLNMLTKAQVEAKVNG